ncbi:MAG: hypothetical protein C0490_20425 [Marivirga sp.]|nr:hypothetical protein [Marivirga sp.]
MRGELRKKSHMSGDDAILVAEHHLFGELKADKGNGLQKAFTLINYYPNIILSVSEPYMKSCSYMYLISEWSMPCVTRQRGNVCL